MACGFPPVEGASAYGVMAGFNVVGMLLGHEPVRLPSLFFILLILYGVVGLQLCTPRP